ncbi:hypothetical protein DL768_009520 [Monosporascus sp. mg162]|nr:hypothetical protein DL768_009520 [Monosporascus sp. mg162]
MPLDIFPSSLPEWARSLASILPLSTLIEFVDVATQLHVYELRGSVPHWNWPVTPSGARLLLSDDDTTGACLLDLPHRSMKLDCFDGRHGNQYPCSAPTTTRLWAAKRKVDVLIPNSHGNMKEPTRKQAMRVLHLRDATPGSDAGTGEKTSGKKLLTYFRTRGLRYLAVSCIGWVCWTGLVVLSFLGGLYISGPYLLLMPMMGIVVGFTHGNTARMPQRRDYDAYQRLIIASGSENGYQWFAFYGDQTLLNGLLNLPLYRAGSIRFWPFFSNLLRVLIVSQWGLALGSSAMMGWDAFIIATWTTFCILMSAYVYPSNVAARDWLRRNCQVEVVAIDIELSSRWSMLCAMGTINPDITNAEAKWMDSILGPTPDRHDVWTTLKEYSLDGDEYDASGVKDKWWWKFLVEGREVGKSIKRLLEADIYASAKAKQTA